MHVGIAKTTGVDFHDYLVRPCLGRFPLLYFPLPFTEGTTAAFIENMLLGIRNMKLYRCGLSQDDAGRQTQIQMFWQPPTIKKFPKAWKIPSFDPCSK
jgi:hypothetical protein